LWLAAPLILLAAGGAAAAWYYRAEPRLRAAELALERRDYTSAKREIDAYLRAWPDSARAHLLAARTARRLQLFDEAQEHLRAVERLKGDAQAVALERVLADFQRGEAKPAAEKSLWNRIDAGDPDAPAILEVLTQYYLLSYNLLRAKECLDRYLTLRPNDLQALLGRAYIWERMLYFADAEKDYRQAVAAHPDDVTAHLRLAKSLLVRGEPEETLEHFEFVRRRRPNDPAVLVGVAQCLRRLRRDDEAARLLDDVLADRPDDADALTERARTALDMERPYDPEAGLRRAEAEAWLRRAVAAAPHDREARVSLYQCLLREEKGEEAAKVQAVMDRMDADLKRLEIVRREVLKLPDDAGLRCEGGEIFLSNGQEEEGVHWLTQALRIDPSHRRAHRALADFYAQAGRRDLAEQHAKAAGP
jgi:tetratricopeptide (TPR) repeat protein